MIIVGNILDSFHDRSKIIVHHDIFLEILSESDFRINKQLLILMFN